MLENEGQTSCLDTHEKLTTENVTFFKEKDNVILEEEYVLFDWFQCTLLNAYSNDDTLGFYAFNNPLLKSKQIFKEFFNIEENDLVYESFGINGYKESVSYKDIYIMWNQERTDMGIHIKMSGEGCRTFELLGLDYYELFIKIQKYTVNFNRIDISVDCFTDKYFTLSTLLYWCRAGLVSSSFLTCLNLEKVELNTGYNLGHTLQFGSKASDIQITFYDKLKERKSKNIIVAKNIKHWIRTEVRFRHDKAKQIIDILLNSNQEITYILKSILYNYISFKVLESEDNSIYRRPNAIWWDSFLGSVDKLKLKTYLPEQSITRKIRWLNDTVSKTYLLGVIATISSVNYSGCENIIIDLLKTGVDKINKRDLQLLNEYRNKEGLQNVTYGELYDLISEINDFVFLSNDKQVLKGLVEETS